MGIKDQLDQLVESLAHGPSETQSILAPWCSVRRVMACNIVL